MNSVNQAKFTDIRQGLSHTLLPLDSLVREP
jgi:hypothetical protein